MVCAAGVQIYVAVINYLSIRANLLGGHDLNPGYRLRRSSDAATDGRAAAVFRNWKTPFCRKGALGEATCAIARASHRDTASDTPSVTLALNLKKVQHEVQT